MCVCVTWSPIVLTRPDGSPVQPSALVVDLPSCCLYSLSDRYPVLIYLQGCVCVDCAVQTRHNAHERSLRYRPHQNKKHDEIRLGLQLHMQFFLSRSIYICFLLLLLLLSEGAAIPARWIDPGESFISFIFSFVLFHAV